MKKYIGICLIPLVILILVAGIFMMSNDITEFHNLVESRPMRVDPYLEDVRLEFTSISEYSLEFTIFNDSEYGIYLFLDRRASLSQRDFSPVLQTREGEIWQTISPHTSRGMTAESHHALYVSAGDSHSFDWSVEYLSPFRPRHLYRVNVDAVRVTSYYIFCTICRRSREYYNSCCLNIFAHSLFPHWGYYSRQGDYGSHNIIGEFRFRR